jgi:DDB1- and CUL4-associated factor 8
MQKFRQNILEIYSSNLQFLILNFLNFSSAQFSLNGPEFISCGADGLVIQTAITSDTVRKWRCNAGSTHKLCSIPQFPHVFYSCGEDGTVRYFDFREAHYCGEDQRNRYSANTCTSSVLINTDSNPIFSMAINPIHPVLIVLAVMDEFIPCYDTRFLRSSSVHGYNSDAAIVEKFQVEPNPDDENAYSMVTSVAYSNDGSEIIGSYSDDAVYLFDTNNSSSGSVQYDAPNFCSSNIDITVAPQGSNKVSKWKKFYNGHIHARTVKECNFFGPNSEYILSGSDDGYVYIWQKNSTKLVKMLKADDDIVNCVQGHPFTLDLVAR